MRIEVRAHLLLKLGIDGGAAIAAAVAFSIAGRHSDRRYPCLPVLVLCLVLYAHLLQHRCKLGLAFGECRLERVDLGDRLIKGESVGAIAGDSELHLCLTQRLFGALALVNSANALGL